MFKSLSESVMQGYCPYCGNDSFVYTYEDEKMFLCHHCQRHLRYEKVLKNDNLKDCPEYWGGYTFVPYYFEFWEGHESRLNKREVYEMRNGHWEHFILQP